MSLPGRGALVVAAAAALTSTIAISPAYGGYEVRHDRALRALERFQNNAYADLGLPARHET